MATNTKARLFTMEDAPGLTRLNKEFYGVTRDDAFWKWKYFDLPGCHFMSVIGDPQDLTGQVGAIALPMQYDGQAHMLTQAQDILIRKDGRQSRAFFLLERVGVKARLEKDIHLDFGFSIDITRKLATHSLGFSDIGAVPKMVRPLHSLPYIRKKLKIGSLARLLAPVYDALRLRPPAALRQFDEPGIRIERVERFDPSFDTLWDEAKDTFKAIIRRDSRYLNWRYVDNPASSYDIFAAYDDTEANRLLGFIVLEERHGIRNFESLDLDVPDTYRGDLMDMLTVPGDAGRRALRKLIHHAYREFERRGVDIIVCWCFEHMPVHAELARLGFTQRSTPHTLIVRSDHPEIGTESAFFKLGSWYLTRGDCDHY